MRRLMMALGCQPDVRLWRQNVGAIAVRDPHARIIRVFRAGPPKGAADLSGIVRPEGWRLEIEVKASRGRRSKEQARWGAFITAAGGIYALAAYDAACSLDENVRMAVQTVEHAIRRKRCPESQ